MKKILFILASVVLFLTTACTDSTTIKSYNQGINIIPHPNHLTQNEGEFALKKKATIYASSPELKTVGEYFAAKINASTGYKISVTEQLADPGISLIIDQALDVNEEGYTLEVTPQEVQVRAKTPQGAFYGMQTFMQLLPAEIESPTTVRGVAWTAAAVSIKDEPRFSYRGLMIDPCRHFIPVEYVKKHIDILALFKVNKMHWHLTDDQAWRIEIKKYPKLTEIGSKRVENGETYGPFFYTQEEIKEVVDYAAERFIEVVPEIELPGHGLAAIAAYPELSCKGEPITPRIIWGVEDVVFCAGKEETFQFLEDVFTEVIALFPGKYYHIGGDECPKDQWKVCPLCQQRKRTERLKDEHELQSYFVQRMEKFLNQHDKSIIGWDEILEGGLAPSATVMSWRGEEGGIAAASMEHDVIMTPNPNGMYIDQFEGDPKREPVSIGGYSTIEKIYNYNPVPDTLAALGKAGYVQGVQCNAWSEYMYTPELNQYRVSPRIIALAEIGWTEMENKDYKDFERRIDNAYVRLDGHDINYHIPLPEQVNGSCDFVAFTDKATLTFKSSRPISMVYTTDGSEPTVESTLYEEPIELTESTLLKIRSLLPSGKMSRVIEITVEKQELAPALTVENLKPGLKMQITDGEFLDTAPLASITEWREKVITSTREITRQVEAPESMRGVKQYAAVASGYVQIPEDGVYFISSDLEEVWIDGKLLISNKGEVKRFSRNDRSVALAAGLHEIKAVFLGHIIGGWPSNWNSGNISLRKSDAEKFTPITPEMIFYP